MFYRTAGTLDVYLHNWFLQLQWKRMLWMCWQCQINQLLFCEMVDMLLNSQATQWSKPKCFLPPRWTQQQFRRCFILRTNRSSARTIPGLVSSALHSPLRYPNGPCTFKNTICSGAISFIPLAACCVHTPLRWQIAQQPSCYFRYSNWNNLKKIKIMSSGHKDPAWGSGTGLWATVLPVRPRRRLFTGNQWWSAL